MQRQQETFVLTSSQNHALAKSTEKVMCLQPEEENGADLSHEVDESPVQHVEVAIPRQVLHVQRVHVVQHERREPANNQQAPLSRHPNFFLWKTLMP